MPLQFVGDAREYFRIWIVNVFLTVLTLGVYSAWAKVRTERYFHGNTLLDGHRFNFVADPVRILRGRLLAVLALVTYTAVWHLQPQFGLYALAVFMIVLPTVLVLAVGFRLHNTVHRNIRFRLDRDFLGIYRAIGIPIAIALVATWLIYSALAGSELRSTDLIPLIFGFVLLPLMPYLDFARSRFIATRAHYGDRRLGFKAGAGRFYGIYALAFGLFVLAMLAVAVLVGIAAAVFSTKDGDAAGSMSLATTVSIGAMYAVWLYVWGFVAARRRNLLHGSLRIGDAAVTSDLSGVWMGWLYLSNTVAIIASVGLLIPWAKIRTARYVAACTLVDASSLDSVLAGADRERTAAGEEIGEAFGYDLGF